MYVRLATAAAALLLVGSAWAGSSARGSYPALKVDGTTVRGSHFQPREPVRITFVAPDARSTRRLRTTSAGTFATTLPTQADPCLGALVVIARGATGDSARLKLPQRACLPQ